MDLSAIRVPAVLAGVDMLPHEREPLFGGGGGVSIIHNSTMNGPYEMYEMKPEWISCAIKMPYKCHTLITF